MPDYKYCYPGSNVLKNKLNIHDAVELKKTETTMTFWRLQFLEKNPIQGKFDFNHLKKIHKYVFQDLYSWAGQIRTTELYKENSMFCTIRFLNDYAKEIFEKYFPECKKNAKKSDKFIEVLAKYYGDLNALHPFREGNGRTQREFARTLCLKCGYIFDLTNTTHKEMVAASKLSFQKNDNSKLQEIFSSAVVPVDQYIPKKLNQLLILSTDDLSINDAGYGYSNNYDSAVVKEYDALYKERIKQLKHKSYNVSR